MVSFDEFAEVFLENTAFRSRTIKGISDTSVNAQKPKAAKKNRELIRQVEVNTQKLIRTVWNDAQKYNVITDASGKMRERLERWDDIINSGLRSAQSRMNPGANPHYRTWTVDYGWKIRPEDLESEMKTFYTLLHAQIGPALFSPESQAGLLAWADCMLDGLIHPWADGCGRSATALVMWLSLLSPFFKLPRFGPREEHYRTIEDIEKHSAYYRQCLAR